MIVNFLIWLAKRNPFVHIPGYMNRWWLIPYTKFPEVVLKVLPFLRWFERKIPAVRLHEILRSDNDRDLHDHPWPFVSVILRGGYYEERPKYDRSGLYIGLVSTFHGPGDILFRKASDFHRLTLGVRSGGPTISCWTLFITFAYAQKWGFLIHPDYKMRYEEYQAAHPSSDPEVQAFRSGQVQRLLGEGYQDAFTPIVTKLPEISPAEYYWRNGGRDRRKENLCVLFRSRKTD